MAAAEARETVMWMGWDRGVAVRLRARSLTPSLMPWRQREARSSRIVRGDEGEEAGRREVERKCWRVSRFRGVSSMENLVGGGR